MLLKYKIIDFFNKLITLLKYLVLPVIIGFLSGKLVYANISKDKMAYYYNWFFWLSVFGVYYLLIFDQYLYSISYYILFGLITSVFIVKYIQPYLDKLVSTWSTDSKFEVKFSTPPYEYTKEQIKSKILLPPAKFLMWFLYVITLITLFGTIYTFYYKNKIKNKEGPIGDKGEPGAPGESGEKGELTGGNNLAYLQLMKTSEEVYGKFKQIKIKNITDKYGDIDIEPYDKNKDYINNNFLKDNIKRIVHSDKFNELIEQSSLSEAIEKIRPIISTWIKHILKFKGGDLWLESHFNTDYHWKTNPKYGEMSNDPEVEMMLDKVGNIYNNSLLDKLKVIHGKYTYNRVIKTLNIFNKNKFIQILPNKDLFNEKLEEVRTNNPDNILNDHLKLLTVSDLMEFFESNKNSTLLELSSEKVQNPFIYIFSDDVWKYGEVQSIDKCELEKKKKEQEDFDKTENLEKRNIRMKRFLDTRYNLNELKEKSKNMSGFQTKYKIDDLNRFSRYFKLKYKNILDIAKQYDSIFYNEIATLLFLFKNGYYKSNNANMLEERIDDILIRDLNISNDQDLFNFYEKYKYKMDNIEYNISYILKL